MDRQHIWLGIGVVLLALMITLIGIFALSEESSYDASRTSSAYAVPSSPVVLAQQYNTALSSESYAAPCHSQITGYINGVPQRTCVNGANSLREERDGDDTRIYVNTYNYGGYNRYDHSYRDYYRYTPSYRYYPHYTRSPYYGYYGYHFSYY